MAAVMEGAEPFSTEGGPQGVLVLHGFTGNPQSMRGLAEAFAEAGFTTELPLLPGHGTAVEDMLPTRWDDWWSAADAAYRSLAARCERVVVAGLSMGGTLACRLSAEHPDVAGMVAVNPLVEPPAPSFIDIVRGSLEAGVDVIPGVGGDIAKPGVTESAYEGTPTAAILSLFDAVSDLQPRLGAIACPVLLFTSRQDHVVPPSSSEHLLRSVSGPVEHVWLDKSFHVATLDYDAEHIRQRAVEFARRVAGA